MDTKLLMSIAYRGIVEELAEIEQRQAMRACLRQAALPVQQFYRQLHATRHDAWAERGKTSGEESESDRRRYERLRLLIEELEELYKEWHEKDDQQWAEAMADYLRGKFGRGT